MSEYALTVQVARGTAETGYEYWTTMCRLVLEGPLTWEALLRLRNQIALEVDTDLTQVAILSCIALATEAEVEAVTTVLGVAQRKEKIILVPAKEED